MTKRTNTFYKYTNIKITLYKWLRRHRIGKFATDTVTLVKMVFKTDWKEIRKWNSCFKKKSLIWSILDAVRCFYKYRINFANYFIFRFPELSETERASWLGSPLRYDFLRDWSPWGSIQKLAKDKYQSYKRLAAFYGREMHCLERVEDIAEIEAWIQSKGSFIVKPRFGNQGLGIEICRGLSSIRDIKAYLTAKLEKGSFVFEELIEQDPRMSNLYPKSVNTLRIITLQAKDAFHILSVVLRLGNGKDVDNLHAGGIAAPIDLATGIVSDTALGGDPCDNQEYPEHPISKVRIKGFQIPFWQEILTMLPQMGALLPELKCIAWDIAVTSSGPVLVEVNVYFATDLFQIPYKKGRLEVVAPFMNPADLYPAHKKYLKGKRQ
jgi:hypothetical protein